MLSVLTASCISIQLTPRPPNVEFTSLICFTVGAVFGCKAGSSLGAMVMLVNGFLSPYGFAGMLMPFQMAGMALMGFVGGVYGKSLRDGLSTRSISAEAAVLGAFFTLIYDIITNAACAPWYGGDVILALIAGTWFTAVHVASNAVAFGLALAPLLRALKRLTGSVVES